MIGDSWQESAKTRNAVGVAPRLGRSSVPAADAGAVAFTPRYLLALGGIVIGNAMAITTLTARRFLQAADEHWDEVEGWLALGAVPRSATRRIACGSIHTALVPTIDQTKTTGLVTLPGAFVGAVFGGLSPLRRAVSRWWSSPRSWPPARSHPPSSCASSARSSADLISPDDRIRALVRLVSGPGSSSRPSQDPRRSASEGLRAAEGDDRVGGESGEEAGEYSVGDEVVAVRSRRDAEQLNDHVQDRAGGE